MLVSERIQVETASSPAGRCEPGVILWRDRRLVIEEILSAWTDAGNPARKWYQRRYRNYYRVRCDDGQVYEIYLERQTARRQWFLKR